METKGIKITGPVECLKCHWTGGVTELNEKEEGLIIECPSCNHVLIDLSNGNFIVRDIKAEKLQM